MLPLNRRKIFLLTDKWCRSLEMASKTSRFVTQHEITIK